MARETEFWGDLYPESNPSDWKYSDEIADSEGWGPHCTSPGEDLLDVFVRPLVKLLLLMLLASLLTKLFFGEEFKMIEFWLEIFRILSSIIKKG